MKIDIHAAKSIQEDCLGLRIKKLDRAINRLYDQALSPFEITLAQFGLLIAIAQLPEAPPAILGRKLLLEKSSLSRNLDRLAKAGLLRLTASEGGRTESVAISASGVRKLEAARPAWEKAQKMAKEILGTELLSSLKQRVDSPDFEKLANEN